MATEEEFSGWCIVEVMGHKSLAGFLSKQVIAGTSFIRVDVPEIEAPTDYFNTEKQNIPAFTQMLGAGSIYCITPCTEKVARRAATSFIARPVEHLDLTVKQLPPPASEEAISAGDEGAEEVFDYTDDRA